MNNTNSQFTFKILEEQYRHAIDYGYQFMTCFDYTFRKESLPKLSIVNRVDIDCSVKKAERLLDIFNRLNIKGSFFIRLHASEYNPFSFENFRILKAIRDSGHEIGYHSEVVDESAIWHEEPAACLRRDIAVLNSMLEIEIKGVASHGGLTGLNNLDFWKNHSPSDFGLIYEAYGKDKSFNLFDTSFYISDSEWTRWKCYDKGKLVSSDQRSLAEHLVDKHPLIYLLVHSDTYYDKHFYE